EQVDQVADPGGEVVAGAQHGLRGGLIAGGLCAHQPLDELAMMAHREQLVLLLQLGQGGTDALDPDIRLDAAGAAARALPAVPAEWPTPRSIWPSTITPAPTPVPRLTARKSRYRRPAPNHSSPVASAIRALSMRTGAGIAARSASSTGTSCHPQLGANTSTPRAGSTWPGRETPAPSSSPTSSAVRARSLSTASRIRSAMVTMLWPRASSSISSRSSLARARSKRSTCT